MLSRLVGKISLGGNFNPVYVLGYRYEGLNRNKTKLVYDGTFRRISGLN